VARVFLAQMETLKRYRSGGEQKVGKQTAFAVQPIQ
jgi:hypothetical protein